MCDSATHVGAYLGAPQLDGPVEGGRGEEVGEVHGAHGVVAADARHRPLVALEHLTDTCLAVGGGEGGMLMSWWRAWYDYIE